MDGKDIEEILSDAKKKIEDGLLKEAIVTLLSALPDSTNVENAYGLYNLLSVAYGKMGNEKEASRYKQEAEICIKHLH